MSTKNITRTAIEGGRVKSNKHQRWQSNRTERRTVAVLLRRFEVDPEAAEERCLPVRVHIGKEFNDKLSPAYRWLEKKTLGRHALAIRGLLLRTFDTRTLAGRHLVFDHLMPTSYRGVWSCGFKYSTLNERGFMVRHHSQPSTTSRTSKKARIRSRQWLQTINELHRIGQLNGDYCLFELNGGHCDVECVKPWCRDRYMSFDSATSQYVRTPHPRKQLANGTHPVPFHTVRAYRVVRQLTPSETQLWLATTPHALDLALNP